MVGHVRTNKNVVYRTFRKSITIFYASLPDPIGELLRSKPSYESDDTIPQIKNAVKRLWTINKKTVVPTELEAEPNCIKYTPTILRTLIKAQHTKFIVLVFPTKA